MDVVQECSDAAAFEQADQTAMEVPTELVPVKYLLFANLLPRDERPHPSSDVYKASAINRY